MSVIMPALTYVIECWWPTNKGDRCVVERVHRRVLRYCTGEYSTPYLQLCRTLSTTPLQNIAAERLLRLWRSIVMGQRRPPCEIAMTQSCTQRRSSRSSHRLCIELPLRRGNRVDLAATRRAIRLWNDLPKDAPFFSHDAFKHYLRHYLTDIINEYFSDLTLY